MQNVHFMRQTDKERHLEIRTEAEQEMLSGEEPECALN